MAARTYGVADERTGGQKALGGFLAALFLLGGPNTSTVLGYERGIMAAGRPTSVIIGDVLDGGRVACRSVLAGINGKDSSHNCGRVPRQSARILTR